MASGTRSGSRTRRTAPIARRREPLVQESFDGTRAVVGLRLQRLEIPLQPSAQTGCRHLRDACAADVLESIEAGTEAVRLRDPHVGADAAVAYPLRRNTSGRSLSRCDSITGRRGTAALRCARETDRARRRSRGRTRRATGRSSTTARSPSGTRAHATRAATSSVSPGPLRTARSRPRAPCRTRSAGRSDVQPRRARPPCRSFPGDARGRVGALAIRERDLAAEERVTT